MHCGTQYIPVPYGTVQVQYVVQYLYSTGTRIGYTVVESSTAPRIYGYSTVIQVSYKYSSTVRVHEYRVPGVGTYEYSTYGYTIRFTYRQSAHWASRRAALRAMSTGTRRSLLGVD